MIWYCAEFLKNKICSVSEIREDALSEAAGTFKAEGSALVHQICQAPEDIQLCREEAACCGVLKNCVVG